MDVVMFSKKLIDYDIAGVGSVASKLGFDGVDLTVREGGHVRPEDVTANLPPAVGILGTLGLKVPMITTGVTSAQDACARETFAAASESGVGYLKLGYWQYSGFGSVHRQIDEAREKVKGIQALAKEYGVIACLHIHSGDYLTATGDLVSRILEEVDPEYVGAYIDPGHMVVEGTRSGWKLGIDLLRDSIKMVAVKDFCLEKDPDSEKKWILKHMPLNRGMVPWPEVFSYLRKISFDGPVSLHSEYEMSTEKVIAQTAEDLAYVKAVISDAWGSD